MFLRTHRIRRRVYTEALESYREGGNPRHRCVARWPFDQPLAVALGEARFRVERDRDQVAQWRGIMDRTAARRPQQVRAAPRMVKIWQARLAVSTASLAGLEAVAAKLPPVEADVQAAAEAARQRWNQAIPPQFSRHATRP
jgi:hypothetical protein